MAATITVCGSRIANATRVWQADENLDATDWTKSNDFIFAIAFQADAGHGNFVDELKIRWRKVGGTWADLGSTGALNYNATTDLVNEDALTSGEAGCTGAGTWQDGIEREGANNWVQSLPLGYWTEIQFAIDCSGAEDSAEYEFELYNVDTSSSYGTCASTITMEAGAAGVQVNATCIAAVGTMLAPVIKTAVKYTATLLTALGTLLAPTEKTAVKYDATAITAQATVNAPAVIGWYNSNWLYRIKCTVDYTKVSIDAEFPVYIDLDQLPADFFTHVKTNGADIRITEGDGVTEVPREVVYCDKSGTAGEVHTKLSLSSTVNTDLYIYYGNSGASDYGETDTYGKHNVWDSNYKGVYHLAEASGTLYDSTGNSNDSSSINGTPDYAQTGVVGKCLNFEKDDTEYADFGDVSDFDFTGDFTVALFAKTSTDITVLSVLASKGSSAGWGISEKTTEHWYIWVNGTEDESSYTINDGAWHRYVLRRSGSGTDNVVGFFDKSKDLALTNTADASNSNNCRIANWSSGSYSFDGLIDELRISAYARSDDWLDTEFENLKNNTSFFSTIGSEEQKPSNDVQVYPTVIVTLGTINAPAIKTAVKFNGTVIAGLGTIPIPTIKTAVSFDATTIAGLGAIIVPSDVKTAVKFNHTAISGLGTIPAPTIKTAVKFNGTVIAGLGSIHTPTTQIGTSFDATVIAALGTPISPSAVKTAIKYDATVMAGIGAIVSPATKTAVKYTATVIPGLGTVYVPVIQISGDVEFNATVIAAEGAILSPTIKTAVSYDATTLAGLGAVITPSIKIGNTFTATAIGADGVILAPIEKTGVKHQGTVIAGLGNIISPTIKTAVVYTATVIPGLGTVYVPTIIVPSGEEFTATVLTGQGVILHPVARHLITGLNIVECTLELDTQQIGTLYFSVIECSDELDVREI